MSMMTRKRPSSSETNRKDESGKRLQTKPSSEPETDSALVRRMRRRKKFLEGLVRLGSKPANCDLQLFPLDTYSLYVRRRLQTIGESGEDSEGSPLIIEIPECPGDLDIFGIVEDFCLGIMDEEDICVFNVVKLIATSTFLEMESLTSKALKFLEESAFNSLENCLSVLATFDDNDFKDDNDETFGEGSLFDKCEKAFLQKIEVEIYPSAISTYTMSCSIQNVLRMAELLPPNVARHIYHSCRKEKFGLFYVSTRSQSNLSLTSHVRGKDTLKDASIVCFVAWHFDRWEGLPSSLPDWSRRSVLMLHLAKSIQWENNVNFSSPKVWRSLVRWDFLSTVLVELVELRAVTPLTTTPTPNIVSTADMDAEIVNLQRLVGYGLREGTWWILKKYPSFQPGEHDFFLQTVKKFKFDTLLSIVGQLRDSGSNHEHILSIARILDACLTQHLKEKKFTVQQALLICGEFPNNSRSNPADIYYVFEDSLRRKALSPQEVFDLTKLFDYSKLSDYVVEKLIAEVQFHCDPRLRERFMVKQRERQINQEKSKEEHNVLTADCVKVRQELNERSAELNDVRRDLQEEREKTTCQICFAQPRDALSLPCMHFLYCFNCLHQHHQKSKTCPTCRGPTTGLLKCLLSI